MVNYQITSNDCLDSSIIDMLVKTLKIHVSKLLNYGIHSEAR